MICFRILNPRYRHLNSIHVHVNYKDAEALNIHEDLSVSLRWTSDGCC